MIVIFNIKFCNGNFVLKLFLCIFADRMTTEPMIMKKCFAFLLMLSGCLTVFAQHATIDKIETMGYMTEFDDMGYPTGVNVVAKVTLTYDQIGKDQAGCIILVNNQKLPQINTGNDLLANAQTLSYGSADVPGSTVKKTAELEISLPMDDRLSGQEKLLYAQAFVLFDENNPKLLAKSNVVNINPRSLKSMQGEMDTEEATENMKRKLIGGVLGDMVRNPSAIDENGYKICSACHGNGTIRDDSYNHAEERESGRPRTITTTTCEYCGGAGKVKATEADYEMNRAMEGALDSSGVSNDALYDFFTKGSTDQGKTKKSKTTQNDKTKTKKNSNGNADQLNKLLDSLLGF